MRDTTIFYRSFFEAIKELDIQHQQQLYNGIFEYSLDFKEQNFTGVCKTVWTLIKPQLDANLKRFENGSKPKQKQKISETEAKKKQTKSKYKANNNNNEECGINNNNNKSKQEKELHTLQKYVIENLPRVSKLKNQLTFENCEELLKKYSEAQIHKVLMSMENYTKLNYVSVYLTLLKWLDKEYDNQEAVIPPKKEVKEIPASYIFNQVQIDYGKMKP